MNDMRQMTALGRSIEEGSFTIIDRGPARTTFPMPVVRDPACRARGCCCACFWTATVGWGARRVWIFFDRLLG
jgi:hypothetical protein